MANLNICLAKKAFSALFAGHWRWLVALLQVGKIAWQSGQGSLLVGHPVAYGAHWRATLLHLLRQIGVRPSPRQPRAPGA